MAANPKKHFGVVYTPRPIVDLMLDACPGGALADVRICDPACGDGEFLVPLAERVCRRIKQAGKNRGGHYRTLNSLTGFDIDGTALDECRKRLDAVIDKNRLGPVAWNLRRIDAIDAPSWERWIGRFDYVVGNPPYVRVQRLEKDRRDKIKNGSWNFMRGACDLYLLFFDMGLRLLKSRGKMAFITPSSWMTSDSGKAFREHLRRNHRISALFDFGRHQVFQNATTYTTIAAIEKDAKPSRVANVEKCVSITNGAPEWRNGYRVYLTDEKWRAMSKADRAALRRRSSLKLSDIADIHVGVQTLADDVFVLPEGAVDLEPEAVRRIYKASAMKKGKDAVNRVVIYPYENGKLLPEDEFEGRFPKAYGWLLRHRKRLLGRDKGAFPPDRWHGFGRDVSIVKGFGKKILTSGMNPKPDFQYCDDADSLFYGGYCVKPHPGVSLDDLLEELNSPFMERYIALASRPYRNGWFSYAKSFIKDFPLSERAKARSPAVRKKGFARAFG